MSFYKNLSVVVVFLLPLYFSSDLFFSLASSKYVLLGTLGVISFGIVLFCIITHRITLSKTQRVYVIGISVLCILLLITSFTGIDWQTSLWSTFRRGTGFFTIFFAFIISLPLLFFGSDRKYLLRIAKAFVWSGCIVTLFTYPLLAKLFIDAPFDLATARGSTLGNPLFAGAFLLFSFFFALFLYFSARNEKKQRAYVWILGAFFILSSPIFIGWRALMRGDGAGVVSLLGEARATTLALLVGSVFGACLYGAYRGTKTLQIVSKTLIAILTLFLIYIGVSLFVPESSTQNFFVEHGGASRLLFWETAFEGIQERPVLGWGLEHFAQVHQEYFNPLLFSEPYPREFWVDKSHNTILEIAVTAGIPTLIIYLSIFLFALCLLLKKIHTGTKKDAELGSILTALLISYFLQNLFLFDTNVSYVAYFATLAFAVVWSSSSQHISFEKRRMHFVLRRSVVLGIITLVGFGWYHISFLPYREAKETILFLNTPVPLRLGTFEETMEHSRMGGASSVNGIVDRYVGSYTNTVHRLNNSDRIIAEEELLEILTYNKKLADQHTRNVRLQLNTAILSNLLVEAHKEELEYVEYLHTAEEYAMRAQAIAPQNPFSYWTLAQTALLQDNPEKAYEYTERVVALNSEIKEFHDVSLGTLEQLGNADLLQERIEETREYIPGYIFTHEQLE